MAQRAADSLRARFLLSRFCARPRPLTSVPRGRVFIIDERKLGDNSWRYSSGKTKGPVALRCRGRIEATERTSFAKGRSQSCTLATAYPSGGRPAGVPYAGPHSIIARSRCATATLTAFSALSRLVLVLERPPFNRKQHATV
jgi:hypothetical protein